MAPLTLQGERFADADQRMPLPVRLARALGATQVLAVDASARADSIPASAGAYRAADLHKLALTRPDAASADVLLHPAIGYWAGWSRDYRERVIAAGYQSTLAAAPALRALHQG
jgi:NTE family protein